MIEIPVPPSWTADAACVSTDTESFFPDGHGAVIDSLPAKRVCAGCPARSVIGCAQTALDLNERYMVTGIWAGQYLSANTRKGGTREQALRALHTLVGTPFKPEGNRREWVRHCKACARKMRPRNDAAEPGIETVRYGARGMCDTCATAKRKGAEVSTFIKEAV